MTERDPLVAGEVTSSAQASPHPPSPSPLQQKERSTGSRRPTFVYALGHVEPRFPTLAAEKEYRQAVGRAHTDGKTDREVMAAILTDRANRYLARLMCWVFVIQGLETYLLMPSDPTDLDLLVLSLRADPDPSDMDLVVGVRGPVAPPDTCNGIGLPIVLLEQLYSFDRQALISALPPSENGSDEERERFQASARELLDYVLQLADNSGATDEQRAMNYCLVRYPAIYSITAEEHARNASLASVQARLSDLSVARRVVEVVFVYTHRQSDVSTKYACRVDVTEQYPFLVSKLSPYFDR
jgi:hypothetical protein